jgi:hypothetical protein
MSRKVKILVLGLLICGVSSVQPVIAEAGVQAYVHRIASDCESLDLGITLGYTHDDWNGEDYYRLRVFDSDSVDLVARVDGWIGPDRTPYYWQTGRIPAVTRDGVYRIEMWDVGEGEVLLNPIDSVYYDCKNGESRRIIDAEQEAQRELDSEGRPKGGACIMPLYTTNTAPADGVVIVMWRREPGDTEFHVETLGVNTGDQLSSIPIYVPCAVNIRAYYQPFDAGGALFMPSQYYPDDDYGTPGEWEPNSPPYHTAFPDWPLQ